MAHKKNHPSQDLELAMKVFALNIWKHYLYYVHGKIYLDNRNLDYIFNQRDLI